MSVHNFMTSCQDILLKTTNVDTRGTTGKVKGLPKSLGFILLAALISAPNFMANSHPIVASVFAQNFMEVHLIIVKYFSLQYSLQNTKRYFMNFTRIVQSTPFNPWLSNT